MDLERVDDLNVKGLIHALHQAYYKRAQKGKRTVMNAAETRIKRRKQKTVRVVWTVLALLVIGICVLVSFARMGGGNDIHISRLVSRWGLMNQGFHRRAPDGKDVTFLREIWIGPYDDVVLIRNDALYEWRKAAASRVGARGINNSYIAAWNKPKRDFFWVTIH